MFLSEDWKLVPQTLSANRAGMMLDMCERLVPPRAVDTLISTSTKYFGIADGFRASCRWNATSCLLPFLLETKNKQTNGV